MKHLHKFPHYRQNNSFDCGPTSLRMVTEEVFPCILPWIDISFIIRPHRVTAIVSESGCGKTTLTIR